MKHKTIVLVVRIRAELPQQHQQQHAVSATLSGCRLHSACAICVAKQPVGGSLFGTRNIASIILHVRSVSHGTVVRDTMFNRPPVCKTNRCLDTFTLLRWDRLAGRCSINAIVHGSSEVATRTTWKICGTNRHKRENRQYDNVSRVLYDNLARCTTRRYKHIALSLCKITKSSPPPIIICKYTSRPDFLLRKWVPGLEKNAP